MLGAPARVGSQEPGEPKARSREEALPSVDRALARESCSLRETFWGECLFTTNAWDCQEIIRREEICKVVKDTKEPQPPPTLPSQPRMQVIDLGESGAWLGGDAPDSQGGWAEWSVCQDWEMGPWAAYPCPLPPLFLSETCMPDPYQPLWVLQSAACPTVSCQEQSPQSQVRPLCSAHLKPGSANGAERAEVMSQPPASQAHINGMWLCWLLVTPHLNCYLSPLPRLAQPPHVHKAWDRTEISWWHQC